jgi:hypothetical protein
VREISIFKTVVQGKVLSEPDGKNAENAEKMRENAALNL